jgi:hypothetical protein
MAEMVVSAAKMLYPLASPRAMIDALTLRA